MRDIVFLLAPRAGAPTTHPRTPKCWIRSERSSRSTMPMRLPIVLIGKSMGGRVGCHVAIDSDIINKAINGFLESSSIAPSPLWALRKRWRLRIARLPVAASVTITCNARKIAMKRCDSAKLPIARFACLLLNDECAGFGLEKNHTTICWRFPSVIKPRGHWAYGQCRPRAILK